MIDLSALNELERPTQDEMFMSVALCLSLRGTCARRRVGCVLTDKDGQVLSTGYNGVPAGETHCIDVPCAGAGALSGTSLGTCQAIHAEQNALLQCADVRRIHTCYTVASPCEHCSKLLSNTGCQRIVYIEDYPGTIRYQGIDYVKIE